LLQPQERGDLTILFFQPLLARPLKNFGMRGDSDSGLIEFIPVQ
jgi:hypothetical protein